MRLGVGLGPFYVSGRIGGRRRRRSYRRPPKGIPWLFWLVIGPLWFEFLLAKWLIWVPLVWLCRTGWARYLVARDRKRQALSIQAAPRAR